MRLSSPIPALLHTMSILPNASFVFSKADSCTTAEMEMPGNSIHTTPAYTTGVSSPADFDYCETMVHLVQHGNLDIAQVLEVYGYMVRP